MEPSSCCQFPKGVPGLNGASHAVCYRQLRSHYYPDRDLHQYVSADLWNTACHNDPEFETFTYGDNGTNGRSGALTKIQVGDLLMFLARLERWNAGRRTGQYGFYLIGGLLVDYAGWITRTSSQRDRFARNAHVIRGDEEFWGIAGSSQSRRFERAVPITRAICDEIFRAANCTPWELEQKHRNRNNQFLHSRLSLRPRHQRGWAAPTCCDASRMGSAAHRPL